MSIVIYAYHDPYRLNKEKFWDEIINCPYFCVSQTLVNGLRKIYSKDLESGRVTTVKNLTDSLYKEWMSTSCVVKQHTAIDNIISMGFSTIHDDEKENIRKAFLLNRDEVFCSIRTMFELNINIQDIIMYKLTPEQEYIVDIFKKILNSEKARDFTLKRDFDEQDISEALIGAMQTVNKGFDAKSVNMDTIVIHGIHQFSPIMIRTIEEIGKYKKVILLFNYQKQYKTVYQTWVDIYSAFDCPISDYDSTEYHPADLSSLSYQGNVLADNMGKLINGRKEDIVINKPYEMIEFDNMTEFAGYVAKVFEDAERINPEQPMMAMQEQIYAADSSANNILKIYFPEQFGERQFLNYPLGHFFIAIANMWDSVTNGIVVNDINDIKECLGTGILEESSTGELITIFGNVESLFEGATTITEMLARLKRMRINRKYLTDFSMQEYVSHISYYTISIDEIKELERALNELEELAAFFYEDFEKRPHNFRDFYKKLKKYLHEEIVEDRELSEEFLDILQRVLERLDEVESIDASASFECLKSTMSIYLIQETKPGKSANWIVRNFEQIDGDVLRTKHETKSIIHFACLTDEDMDTAKRSDFTWPLNAEFFEVAQEPVDWKYQVYVKSRKEYKNFKRYALLFGLEFNRGNFKLSYVKRKGDQEREPYYLLKILGIKKTKYLETKLGDILEDSSNIQIDLANTKKFNEYDYYRWRICKYRFLLESLVEGNTVYKDSFLLLKYLEVWLENETKESMQGLPCSEIVLPEKINEIYDKLKKYFPFSMPVNRIDVINNVKRRLLENQKSFPILTPDKRQFMMIRELFIYKKLVNYKKFKQDVLKDKFPEVTQEKVNEELSIERLQSQRYSKSTDLWCQYCANREICVSYYVNLDT